MTAQRKNIKNDIDTLERILYLCNYKKEACIGVSNEKDFDNTTAYITSVINKLNNKRHKMPIGHRYTGTFYLKKAYTIPYESVKIKGSAFMREDLISWTVESDDDYAKNLWYVRDIYRDKEMKVRLKREDGEAIFD